MSEKKGFASWLFGKKKGAEEAPADEPGVERLGSPLAGTVIAIEQVSDKVFAEKILGDGVAVVPAEGKVYAPADGTVESGLNLAIARRVRDLLTFAGVPTTVTREGDAAIYDPGSATLREKKVSDLHNRVALVNELPGAVLLSIHQNSLPSSPSTRGAQVFWNRQEGAEELASSIQEALNGAVNAGHEKKAAQVPSSVYLMKEITAPGVLVECGFLSNAAETEQLKDPGYQTKLAAAIAAGVLSSDKS